MVATTSPLFFMLPLSTSFIPNRNENCAGPISIGRIAIDKTNNEWDVDLYRSKHSFVWKHGESLVELAAPQEGESALDIGCGSGELTKCLASHGIRVAGMDSDSSMVSKAQQLYPELEFFQGDMRSFNHAEKVDLVFSNAALHWVPREDCKQVTVCIRNTLKPGGRFVAEFGGKGNVELLVSACDEALRETMGVDFECPWYFPSIPEYTALLEDNGFEVLSAELFDRPTPLEEGREGLRNWYRMFADVFLKTIVNSNDEFISLMEGVEAKLESRLYNGTHWIADYRRIRVVAKRI